MGVSGRRREAESRSPLSGLAAKEPSRPFRSFVHPPALRTCISGPIFYPLPSHATSQCPTCSLACKLFIIHFYVSICPSPLSPALLSIPKAESQKLCYTIPLPRASGVQCISSLPNTLTIYLYIHLPTYNKHIVYMSSEALIPMTHVAIYIL